MILNLANKLTLSRIALTVIFVVLMVYGGLYSSIAALLVFCIASITDFFDGYVAKKYKMTTTLGIFLDPLADKLLISAALISFTAMPALNVPAWMIIIIISREFVITGLRGIAANKNVIIPASNFGKFKTTSQITAIIGILLILALKSYIGGVLNISVEHLIELGGAPKALALFMINFPFWSIMVVTLLTLYSGITYVYNNRAIFK